MLQSKKQITMNGASVITEDSKEITVATMFASLSENGKLNTNTTVINNEKYIEYSEEVNADIQAFNLEAMKMIEEA